MPRFTRRKRPSVRRTRVVSGASAGATVRLGSSRLHYMYPSRKNNDGSTVSNWWIDTISTGAKLIMKLGLIALTGSSSSDAGSYLPWCYFIRLAIGPEDLLPDYIRSSGKVFFSSGKIQNLKVQILPDASSSNRSGTLTALLHKATKDEVFDDVASGDVSFDPGVLASDFRSTTVQFRRPVTLRSSGSGWAKLGKHSKSMLNCDGGDVTHYLDVALQSVASNDSDHIALYNIASTIMTVRISGTVLLKDPNSGVSVRKKDLVLTNSTKIGALGQSADYSAYHVVDGVFHLIPDADDCPPAATSGSTAPSSPFAELTLQNP